LPSMPRARSGFFHVGRLSEAEITITPSVDTEDTMIASPRSVRVEMAKEDFNPSELSFGADLLGRTTRRSAATGYSGPVGVFVIRLSSSLIYRY
jgi:hypothetical protein